MTSPVAWREPLVVYLLRGRTTGFGEQGKHVLAFSEVARQIRTTGKQSNFTIPIAELTLESLGSMFLILVSFQVSGASALVSADITGEHFSP